MLINLIPKKQSRLLMALLTTMTLVGCNSSSSSTTSDDDTDSSSSSSSSETSSIDMTVLVKGYDGVFLNGATVTVNDTSEVTDATGLATFSIDSTDSEDELVVNVTEDGFIPQAIVTTKLDETTLLVVMSSVKETLYVDNIEDAQELEAEQLGGIISFDANSFVTSDGEAATGSAVIEVTPWDMNSNEATAMLGYGQATDSEGDRVDLISAGMMTVSFTDFDGNELQLGDDATADIQMDLTQSSINNETLVEGSAVPLWHFDEDQGLWIEEDDNEGIVIASDSSPVGLAVSATVDHFSTWNWDFKVDNDGSVNIACESSDGVATACYVTATITLSDDSTWTKYASVPVDGYTIINMPTTASIEWSASTSYGSTGSASSDSTEDVIIYVEEPTTSNFIQCTVDAIATECDVTVTNDDDDSESSFYSIPSSGATIMTVMDATSLTWSGTTRAIYEDDNIVSYSGETTSGISEDVTIDLSTKVDDGKSADEIQLMCSNPNGYDITTCDIDVGILELDANPDSYEGITIGEAIEYSFEDSFVSADDVIYIEATATDTDNINYSYYVEYDYSDLDDDDLIDLPLAE